MRERMHPESLLQPIGDDNPSGDNLEYDPAFTDMELAAQPGEERQVGDQILAAEDPDWGDVVTKAEAVLEKSHDIRAAVFWAEAILNTRGIIEFPKATAYVRGALEQYWDTCHPELDEDDGDATMRVNAVQGLADSDRVLRALRRVPLAESRVFGRMSLRHVEVAEGVSNPSADMDDVPDSGSVSAAFQDSDDVFLSSVLEAANSAFADVSAIDELFSEKTPGAGPVLEPLVKCLKQIKRAVGQYSNAGADVPADDTDDAGNDEAALTAGGSLGPSSGGAIRSPKDVTNALDGIMAYYARTEPSSPVPVLLERAKRLVSADFLTIIEDMARDGLDEVRRIGGIKSDDDY